jgi:hypothetical protein
MNRKVHYRVHNSGALAPNRSQMNPVYILTPYFLKTHFNGSIEDYGLVDRYQRFGVSYCLHLQGTRFRLPT